MKVKDIMNKDVRSVSSDFSVSQAIDLLFEYKISGLPVVDKENKLVGMFTEKGILRYILPGYLEKVGKFIYEVDPKAIKNKVKELLQQRKVSEIMRREVITAGPETSLAEIARIMLVEKIRRIPIVEKDGKVVGIIAREDIVKNFIKEEMLSKNNFKNKNAKE